MKTNGKRACEVCGTALNEHSEFCPVCALRGVISPPTESLSAISSELCFEHYQVLKNEDGTAMELGRGGMGVTYKAIDTHLRCPVALKIISAQFIGNESARSRFLREARAAASVRHPSVATVHHLGESGGNYFYAMEFVDGEMLEALIHRRGRLEIELALEIVTQVAAGLTAIHKQHLVHRDIKPSNIMLSWEEGRLENIKIIDLGLAKGVTEDTLSIAGSFIGTPTYASPEQFAGLGTDISVFITAPPFEKLRNNPEPTIALLDALLAKDPSRRFQDPAQLQKAMTKVRGAVGSGLRLTADELRSVSAEVTANVSKRKPRKQTVRWVLGVGLCLAGGLIAWFSFFGHAGFLSNQRVAQAVPTEKSIAVLPFDNISPNKDDAYFADGVQDEILNNLAKIAQLKVISRTSMMQYRADAKRDLRQIAIALGVTNVLEGTVRRDGNQVRVSTELIDAGNDHTIWVDSYDRDLTNIFAIQSEIAQTVASRLSAQLSPEERKDIEEKPTSNLEAYDLYLQAKQILGPKSVVLWGSENEAYSKALSLLEEATQKDRNFALAFCLIAKAHDLLYYDRVDHTPGRRELGDAAVKEALRLRPDLSEVHLAVAFHLYACDRDFERARIQIAIAARSLPKNPDLLLLTARIDQVQGRWDNASIGLEKALSLDPRNPELLETLAEHYASLRLYRESDRIRDQAIELEPNEPLFPLMKAESAFAEKGDLKRARAAYEALPSSMRDDIWMTIQRAFYAMCDHDFKTAHEIVSKSPNEEIAFTGAIVPKRVADIWLEMVQGNHPAIEEFGATREQLYRKVEADPTNPFLLSVLADVDVALGRKQEAIRESRQAAAMRPISEDAVDGAWLRWDLTCVYAWADEPDLAFKQLDVLIKMPGPLTYGSLKFDPSWDPLRKDPRFDKLLAELAPRD